MTTNEANERTFTPEELMMMEMLGLNPNDKFDLETIDLIEADFAGLEK